MKFQFKDFAFIVQQNEMEKINPISAGNYNTLIIGKLFKDLLQWRGWLKILFLHKPMS